MLIYSGKVDFKEQDRVSVRFHEFPNFERTYNCLEQAQACLSDDLIRHMQPMINRSVPIPLPQGESIELPVVIGVGMALKIKIHNHLLEKGIDIRDVAKRAGMGHTDSTVLKVLDLSHNSNPHTLTFVLRSIGCRVNIDLVDI